MDKAKPREILTRYLFIVALLVLPILVMVAIIRHPFASFGLPSPIWQAFQWRH